MMNWRAEAPGAELAQARGGKRCHLEISALLVCIRQDTRAREGRNPSTGATIKIAASRKLTFAPAKAVKDVLNG